MKYLHFVNNARLVLWDWLLRTLSLRFGAMMNRPIYTHDCENCVFLGGFITDPRARVDLYICRQGRDDDDFITLLYRWGSCTINYPSGGYGSMSPWIDISDGCHTEARERALDRGLLTKEQCSPKR